MERYLNVQLMLQRDCKLNAVDLSDYNSLGADITNHVMLDFLVYGTNTYPIQNSIKIRSLQLINDGYRQQFASEYVLHDDGTYTYYKFIIPTIDHFFQNGKLTNTINDELFWHEGVIYWYDKTGNEYQKLSKFDLIRNSKVIDDYLEIYNKVYQNHAAQTFYLPAQKLFSVCKLNNCLVSLQKQACLQDECSNQQHHHDRDFLFAAMYVFDYLQDIGNFSEAQRILDNMRGCGYCSTNSINSCGCGAS